MQRAAAGTWLQELTCAGPSAGRSGICGLVQPDTLSKRCPSCAAPYRPLQLPLTTVTDSIGRQSTDSFEETLNILGEFSR